MLYDLTLYGVLAVKGPDAQKLLQGQLTCNLEQLPENGSLLAAHCNPQGRILSYFRIFALDDTFFLLMRRELVPIAKNNLSKYALFYKTTLCDMTNEVTMYGLTDSCNTERPLDSFKCISISNKRSLLFSTDADTPRLTELQTNWQGLEIQDNIATLYPSTSGKFLPQELNLPELGAVSFDKGCYTGQEIIARMHYRGKNQKRMYQSKIDMEGSPSPGSDLYCVNEDAVAVCGCIVDSYSLSNTKHQLLILLDEKYAANQVYLDKDLKSSLTEWWN